MFPWKRKEIYCGFSTKEFNDVCDILAAEKIQFDTRIINQNFSRSRARGMFGTFGLDQPNGIQYYIYVKNQDYENAKYILHK